MPIAQNFTTEILDSVSEGIFTVDKNFKVNFINRAAVEILGYTRKSVVGKFCKNVFRSNACVERCPIATVLETGTDIHGQNTRLKHRNGESVDIRLNATVLRKDRSFANSGDGLQPRIAV